jgi:hypothetical protein|tara:strand:- start:777 stop:1049 length:273 start_codon:yes stop_codon:yes gene_type:complete
MTAFNKAWAVLKEKKEKRNIVWMHPSSTGASKNPVGWVDDGRGPFVDLHKDPDYPQGFDEYVSGHEEKGPLPWKNHEIIDGEVTNQMEGN